VERVVGPVELEQVRSGTFALSVIPTKNTTM
jgi:hypothetical protein